MTKYHRKKVTRKPKRKSAVKKAKMSRAVVPTSHIVKVKYCEMIELDSSYGTVAGYVFRANSIFDPNYTSIFNHQPLGTDEWAKFYGKYEVLSSQIQCKFLTTNDSSAASHIIAIDLRPDANNITDVYQLIEASKASWKINNYQTVSSLSKSYSSRFWADGNNNDSREALVTMNPQEIAYYHILSAGNTPSEDPPVIRVLVCITYIVKYSDPQNLIQS